ncbi:MAG: glycosyltransferase family 4 protein, partial [Desulfovibrionaceae bacterium]
GKNPGGDIVNIALVISSLSPGGAENVLALIADRLARRGHGVHIVTLDDAPPGAPLHPSVTCHQLGLTRPAANIMQGIMANLRRVRALRRTILSLAPDAVLSFMDTTNVLTLLAVGRRLPVAVAERIHPVRRHIGPVWSRLKHWSYRRAAVVAVQTQDMADHFAGRFPCTIIPNPVPPCPATAENRPDRPRVIAMGRLVPQKGFDLLLRAFSGLAKKFPVWDLFIYGEGPQRPELETLAATLGLDGRAFLPGWTQTPRAELAQAEVFALASRYEGFPNALCEAMACGLPVVATDCPSGPRTIIRQDVDGLLVPPEDTAALADALARLMAEPGLRARLGHRAKDISRRFQVDMVIDMWENLLQALARPGTTGN